jgi:hypothetical protein
MYNRSPVTWLEEIGRSNKSKSMKGSSKDSKEKAKKDKPKKADIKSS